MAFHFDYILYIFISQGIFKESFKAKKYKLTMNNSKKYNFSCKNTYWIILFEMVDFIGTWETVRFWVRRFQNMTWRKF